MSRKKLLQSFQKLQGLKDFSGFIGIPAKDLSYILYKLNGGPNGQYINFEIKKRNGNKRVISAPFTGLKVIQRRLAKKLTGIYDVKLAAYGFVKKREIFDNALMHSCKRFVLNIDLESFFPSIHFGRVMGLFVSNPYNFERSIAIIIAKIACYNDKLPQGSPCSPIISNMICSHMDRELSDLAKHYSCYYTRYADDITFSTNKMPINAQIAEHNERWVPGSGLRDIIEKHGFKINPNKTSLRTQSDRQLVTGIVVNNYPNIRRKSLKQIRSMLHDWKINGLEAAWEKHKNKYDTRNNTNKLNNNSNLFIQIVRGKLEYICHIRKRRRKILYNRYYNKYHSVYLDRKKIQESSDLFNIYLQRFKSLTINEYNYPVILGEGPTDFIHLKSAFLFLKKINKFSKLELDFYSHGRKENGGHSILKQFCNNANEHYVNYKSPVVCIFDCDIKDINKEHKNGNVKKWGNNVYSITLQAHKNLQSDNFCIEHLYSEDDLINKHDKNGRRLFLSTEFHSSGIHKKDRSIFLKGKVAEHPTIIDNKVFRKDGASNKNIAMTKRDFAVNIVRREPPFDKMNYSGFEPTFKLIDSLLSELNSAGQ